MTLKQLLEQNPEWADLPIAIYTEAGTYDYVGEAGSVYLDEEEQTVVFSAN